MVFGLIVPCRGLLVSSPDDRPEDPLTRSANVTAPFEPTRSPCGTRRPPEATGLRALLLSSILNASSDQGLRSGHGERGPSLVVARRAVATTSAETEGTAEPPAAGASTAARTWCVGVPGVVPAALGPAEAHQDSDTERIEQGVYHAVDAARAGQQSLVVPVGEEPALGDECSLVTGLDGFSGAVVLLQVLGVIVVPKPARPAALFVGMFPCLSERLPCGVAVADARPRAF